MRRDNVIDGLRTALLGQNLFSLAEQHQVPIWFGAKKNKGWVGQTVEKVAGIPLNSNKSRDGLDFELKTTELVMRKGVFIPKETIKITQMNPTHILEEKFDESQLWQKLERLILVGYHSPKPDRVFAKRIFSITISSETLVKSIREFWEDVQNLVCSGEIKFNINLGSSRDLIQLRPLGDGKQMSQCPITGEFFPARGFYATKKLINLLMSEASLEVSQ